MYVLLLKGVIYMKGLISKLVKNNLFKGLSEDEIDNIIRDKNYIVKSYNKGSIIACEDDECTSLGIVLDGIIEIQKIYLSGKHIVLKRLTNNQVFGEALIFSNKNTYPATIVAVESCNILYIKRKTIINLCLENEVLLENFMSILSNKVLMLNSKIKNISFKSIRHKVINLIIELSKKQKSMYVTLKESKKDIASNLGVPRPSFSRELMKLRDDGYIDFDKNIIKILDVEKLEGELFN